MKYLLIPTLCILASTKAILQKRLVAKGETDFGRSVFFNFVMFLTSAVVLLPMFLRDLPSLETLTYGVVMGLCSAVFQYSYMLALSNGKMSISVMLVNFSMLVPMTVSFLAFDEPIGLLQIIGTVLALLAFVLNAADDEKGSDGVNKRKRAAWLATILIAFAFNGIASSVQKVYSKIAVDFQESAFVVVAYLTAAVVSFVLLLFFGRGRREVHRCIFQKRNVLVAAIVGVVLGVFQVLNTYANSVIDGTIFFAAYYLSTSMMLSVAGVLFFRERLTIKQWSGIGIGVAAILCICLKA